jgi:hypothetical protein
VKKRKGKGLKSQKNWGGVGGEVFLTRGVSHCGLPVYIKKYLKAKEESLKLKYFTMQKL